MKKLFDITDKHLLLIFKFFFGEQSVIEEIVRGDEIHISGLGGYNDRAIESYLFLTKKGYYEAKFNEELVYCNPFELVALIKYLGYVPEKEEKHLSDLSEIGLYEKVLDLD